VISLINELIRDNRRQLQKIRKINERVEGECLITTAKLKDRGLFFGGQRNYFHARGAVSLEEKGEAINVLTSRNAQKVTYAALQASATASHNGQAKKWGDRIANAKSAVSKVTAALTAVNEWSPKTSTAFVQQLVQESVEAYTQVKNYPLSIPNEMVQLAANDQQLKKRLYQWLNLLKASVVENLSSSETALKEINALYDRFSVTLQKLNDLLVDDAKKLASAIENYTTLIKVYAENEKIYTNLAAQNDLLVQANGKWCSQEKANYKTNQTAMQAQLKVFSDLRVWLRKNFGRVREWLKKKYK